jgi:hypothetical protein
LWDSIEIRDTATAGWDAGKVFEYLVLRAFELDGAKVKFSYTVRLFNEEIEQIDGAIHYAGLSCLSESKDFTDDLKVNIAPIAKLRNQLLHRPSGIVGLAFSRTGFTNPARNLCCFSVILGFNPSQDVLDLALSQPKEALDELLFQSDKVSNRSQLINQLADENTEKLQANSVIQGLISFLQTIRKPATV